MRPVTLPISTETKIHPSCPEVPLRRSASPTGGTSPPSLMPLHAPSFPSTMARPPTAENERADSFAHTPLQSPAKIRDSFPARTALHVQSPLHPTVSPKTL